MHPGDQRIDQTRRVERGLTLTLGGLASGLGLAAIASRWMSPLLYGFRPD
jgi:hypothetical protein